jgi:hypothetical protein
VSSNLAVAGVTAVLRKVLFDGVVDHPVLGLGGPVNVTAEAPDLIDTQAPDLADTINLFMYHVNPNIGWRNVELPARAPDGSIISNPPLAIDLYYIVTAYSQRQLYADVLLGYAMQYMHQLGTLTRDVILNALAKAPTEVPILAAADVLDQTEAIKIVPYVMDTEEMSKLWMAFQASYRPSAVYHVSVLLIRNRLPAKSGPPVLTIGKWLPALKRVSGVDVVPGMAASSPALTSVEPPDQAAVVCIGDQLTLQGNRLADGAAVARFRNLHTGLVIDVPATTATDSQLIVQLLPAAGAWRCGIHSVQALIGAGTATKATNILPVAVAPKITAMAKSGGGVATTLALTFTPKVDADQTVSCIIIDQEFFATPPAVFPAATLNFTFDATPFAGRTPYVRLRVDDIDSNLILRTQTPPVFDPAVAAPL